MMKKLKNYYLVGPMGAGKTAVGRYLAKILNYKFYDTDEEIELRTGVDVTLIFEKEGEAGFRLREKKIISELTEKNNIVLATGGGAILSKENRKKLVTRGLVIYLNATVDKQVDRTSKGRERPLLIDNNPREVLEKLMKVRSPLYHDVADIVIMTDDRKISSVAKEIFGKIN
jgi:shikimate kinase